MKNMTIYEEFNPLEEDKTFTDANIAYYQKLWDTLHTKYRTNNFFASLFDKLRTKKFLTTMQWVELKYLLENGKSRYDAGILPKNYL